MKTDMAAASEVFVPAAALVAPPKPSLHKDPSSARVIAKALARRFAA